MTADRPSDNALQAAEIVERRHVRLAVAAVKDAEKRFASELSTNFDGIFVIAQHFAMAERDHMPSTDTQAAKVEVDRCQHGVRHPHPCDDCLDRDIPRGRSLSEHPCYGLSALRPTEFQHRNSWPLSQKDHPYCSRCGTEIEGVNNRQKDGAPLCWEPRPIATPSPVTDETALSGEDRAVMTAAINQNDAMRQELAHVGNLVSDLAKAMGVDQASPDGSWPDLAGRVQQLKSAALASTPQPAVAEGGERTIFMTRVDVAGGEDPAWDVWFDDRAEMDKFLAAVRPMREVHITDIHERLVATADYALECVRGGTRRHPPGADRWGGKVR